MPQFFFDIIDHGIIEVDETGMEFADLHEAVEDAKTAARRMAVEALPDSLLASVTIQVRDGPDIPVVTILVRASAPEVIETSFHNRKAT